MSNIWQDLQWRGLIAQSTDEKVLADLLNNQSITFYIGFDPTAPSLHLGNLMQILLAKRLQLAGHKPLALVGGATGLIGDPKDTGERNLNEEETVITWTENIAKQLVKYFDFFGDNKCDVVNNFDWTSKIDAISLLRDLGKHFSINRMLEREAVSARLNASGISYTEFSYAILQANDYLELFNKHNCVLQTGGSDQWGNITAGVDLVRRVKSKTVHALTTPLMVKADGTKFGKTEAGTVWLSPELTSPYSFYQFWLNTDDRDIATLLKYFSFASKEVIEDLIEKVRTDASSRSAQKYLAQELTTLVHSKEQCEQVILASQALFGQGELKDIDKNILVAALSEAGLTKIKLTTEMPNILDILQQTNLCESKSAAKRTVEEGGAYINNVRISDLNWTPTKSDLIHGSLLVVRRGKKVMAGVEIGG
ncbi:MAG: tyrosine--tRNA ligase [Candidatus Nanopelagicales bacterium]|nr:tyrosine--tRNA ligase [Candidatus Nanopelagicales bacterium]